MGDTKKPRTTFGELLRQVHSLDFYVRVTYATWIVISAMGALIARAYGQLGFSSTVFLALLLALAGTQLPNVISWSRQFSLGNLFSIRPWYISLVAGFLILFVYGADYIPRFLQGAGGSPPTSSPPASPAEGLAVYIGGILIPRNLPKDPFLLQATFKVTTDRLRVSVDYSSYNSGAWSPKMRASVAELKIPLKENDFLFR